MMNKKRKLYCSQEDLLCWFLDEPVNSSLHWAVFRLEQHAWDAAKLWDKQCKTEKYQDYTNRETWAVCLHLNNNQWMRAYSLSMWEEIKDDGTKTQRPDLIGLFEAALESWITQIVNNYWDEDEETEHEWGYGAKADTKSMIMDVGSFWRVNWAEVAEDQMAT